MAERIVSSGCKLSGFFIRSGPLWGALIWAFVRFVLSDSLESVAYDLSDGRRVEMLDPIWLGLGLLAPAL